MSSMSTIHLTWCYYLQDLGYLSSPVAKQTPAPAEATATAPVQAEPPKVTLTPRDVQQHLERLIVRENVPNDDVFAWVQAHAAGDVHQRYFVRAITTAICRSYVEGE